MSEARPFIFEHTECIRDRDVFDQRVGGFALIAQNPVQLIGPHGDVRHFVPGATLFNHITDDLEAALKQMLSGTALSSEARFGFSWIIAHRQYGYPLREGMIMHDEERIDDWLDANTAVLHGALPETLRPDIAPEPFNGLVCRRPAEVSGDRGLDRIPVLGTASCVQVARANRIRGALADVPLQPAVKASHQPVPLDA